MSEVKVAAWNMENSFSDSRACDALDTIKELNADVLFLGEMTWRGDEQKDKFLELRELVTEELGYTDSLISNYYPGRDDRPNQHTMSLWNRLGTTGLERHPFGNRYGLVTTVPELDLTIIGVHPDDNNEPARITYAHALLSYLDNERKSDKPTVAMGDFNALHRSDPKAMLLRIAGLATRHIHIENEYEQTGWKLKFSLARRLPQMAIGGAMGVYSSAGFVDADPSYTPTIGRRPVNFQLDHILGKNVGVSEFKVWDAVHLADHAPISATVHI